MEQTRAIANDCERDHPRSYCSKADSGRISADGVTQLSLLALAQSSCLNCHAAPIAAPAPAIKPVLIPCRVFVKGSWVRHSFVTVLACKHCLLCAQLAVPPRTTPAALQKTTRSKRRFVFLSIDRCVKTYRWFTGSLHFSISIQDVISLHKKFNLQP